jgi:hypothetical protein
MLYELEHVVLPPANFPWWTDLFIRLNTRNLVVNKKYVKAKIYESNTWMNLFAAKQWYKYCELGTLYLKLIVDGTYRIQIIGSTFNSAFGCVNTILRDEVVAGDVELDAPNAEKYDGVFFAVFEDTNNPIQLLSASWCTDKKLGDPAQYEKSRCQ